jgi:cob(I)alamin adenosyltransferase
LAKIYTKTGDKGETGLIGGARVGKDDPRVSACGDVDELNAALGVVRSLGVGAELDWLLGSIQRDLFALGAQLADPRSGGATAGKSAIEDAHGRRLEQVIDAAETGLVPLTAFILPGGAPPGAQLHLARTVCRRAERSVVALAGTASVNPAVLVYLNRLSDLLFTLARGENARAGRVEEEW